METNQHIAQLPTGDEYNTDPEAAYCYSGDKKWDHYVAVVYPMIVEIIGIKIKVLVLYQ